MINSKHVSVWILAMISVLGIMAPVICNDQPLIAWDGDRIIFPFLHENHSKEVKPILNAPITYSNTTIDKANLRWKSPVSDQVIDEGLSRHWLGTNKLGKDVFAGMIYGCRTAVFVGILSVGIAAVIGIFLGMIAGFYGDHKFRISLWQLIIVTFSSGLIVFYLWAFFRDMTWIPLLAVILLSIVMIWTFKINGNSKYRIPLPIDTMINKIIEIRRSIPLLYLLLVISALIDKPSIVTLSGIIALVMWIPFTRHTRANVMALKNDYFVESAKSIGLTDASIMIRHLWPNIRKRLIVIVAFAMSSAILLESTLSFLGLGIPTEQLTWGSMLAEARENPSAWWLAVFPGMGIFLTILSLNLLGEQLDND